jgi:long-chain acyl-CoA synthetase
MNGPLRDDIAELVFTSGTTGDPKGVILTHGNIISNVESAATIMPKKRDYRFLSLLPLSHMLEQTVGLYLPLYYGGTVYYPASRQSSIIFKALNKSHINTMVVVPQIIRVMMQGIEREVHCRGKWSRWRRAQVLASRLPMAMRRWLFSDVHRRLGGNLDFLICGGAQLSVEVAKAWERLGVKVVEGYGATECAPIVAGNDLLERVHGSVGRPMPGVSVRLSEEGEILVKGNNVTQGYWQHERATKTAFTPDGWYQTGDLAEVDTSGRLYLKGRLKELIVMSSGLNVYPEDVEQALNEEDAVLDCIVVGMADQEGNVKLEAAIRLADPDGTSEQINQQLESALRSANERLAPHQRISKLTVWDGDDFPRTSLLKVKRHEVRAFLSNGKRAKPAPQSPRGTENDTFAKVQGILLRLTGTDPCKITLGSDLNFDLGLDSLSRVELSAVVEEELGIDLDERGLSEVETVRELIEAIERKKPRSKALAFPAWSLRPTLRLVRSVIQGLVVFPLHSLVCRPFIIEGREKLENLKPPALFIANHNSHVDTLSILHAMPRCIRQKLAVAAAADYFFRNPSLGDDAIRASLEYCGQLVDEGWSILIFPEGTRSTTGQLQRFKGGIGLLATQLQVPVVPIGVEGGFHILPKGRSLPRPGAVTVRIGAPIVVPRRASHLSVATIFEDAVSGLLNQEQLEAA